MFLIPEILLKLFPLMIRKFLTPETAVLSMILTFQATMRQALPKSCNWLSFNGTMAKNLEGERI